MALCREHHQLQHQQGVHYFVKKYRVIPVRLEETDILKLKLTTKRVLDEFKQNEIIEGYFQMEVGES